MTGRHQSRGIQSIEGQIPVRRGRDPRCRHLSWEVSTGRAGPCELPREVSTEGLSANQRLPRQVCVNRFPSTGRPDLANSSGRAEQGCKRPQREEHCVERPKAAHPTGGPSMTLARLGERTVRQAIAVDRGFATMLPRQAWKARQHSY